VDAKIVQVRGLTPTTFELCCRGLKVVVHQGPGPYTKPRANLSTLTQMGQTRGQKKAKSGCKNRGTWRIHSHHVNIMLQGPEGCVVGPACVLATWCEVPTWLQAPHKVVAPARWLRGALACPGRLPNPQSRLPTLCPRVVSQFQVGSSAIGAQGGEPPGGGPHGKVPTRHKLEPGQRAAPLHPLLGHGCCPKLKLRVW
jgi:hypothetical protein